MPMLVLISEEKDQWLELGMDRRIIIVTDLKGLKYNNANGFHFPLKRRKRSLSIPRHARKDIKRDFIESVI
jgi:hypothetical protein